MFSDIDMILLETSWDRDLFDGEYWYTTRPNDIGIGSDMPLYWAFELVRY